MSFLSVQKGGGVSIYLIRCLIGHFKFGRMCIFTSHRFHLFHFCFVFFSRTDFASPHSIGGEAVPDDDGLPFVHSVSQLQGGSFCGAERKRLPRRLQLAAASPATWCVSPPCACVKVLNREVAYCGFLHEGASHYKKLGTLCWVLSPIFRMCLIIYTVLYKLWLHVNHGRPSK